MTTRLLLSILFFNLMFSCANPAKDPNQEDAETTADTMAGQTSINSACIFSDPDTSVEGIILRNSESALKFLGKGNKVSGGNTQYFYTTDKKLILGLTVHPGDKDNQVSIFTIASADMQDEDIKQSENKIFGTGHGFRLGLSKSDVIQKLGNCYAAKDSTSESIELYYSLEQPYDSRTNLLSRTNMPQYFASYKFKNDKLDHIRFGFEAP